MRAIALKIRNQIFYESSKDLSNEFTNRLKIYKRIKKIKTSNVLKYTLPIHFFIYILNMFIPP